VFLERHKRGALGGGVIQICSCSTKFLPYCKFIQRAVPNFRSTGDAVVKGTGKEGVKGAARNHFVSKSISLGRSINCIECFAGQDRFVQKKGKRKS